MRPRPSTPPTTPTISASYARHVPRLSALTSVVVGVAACTDASSIDEDYPVPPGIGTSSSGAAGAGEGQDNGGISGPDDIPDGGTLGPDGTGSIDGGVGVPFDGALGSDSGTMDGGTAPGPDGDFTPLEDAA